MAWTAHTLRDFGGPDEGRTMRFRRHTAPPMTPGPGGRRLLRDIGIVLAVAVVGFGVAALWLSPVPVVASERTVPRLLGLGLDEARSQLSALGYRIRVVDSREHPVAPRGQIIWQDPPPGVAMDEGGTVELTPSAGRLQAPVPDLTGLDAAQAERILIAAGFTLGTVEIVTDRQRDAGVVLGTRPSAGAARRAGTTVDLIVNGAIR